jgi:hypothetical protein
MSFTGRIRREAEGDMTEAEGTAGAAAAGCMRATRLLVAVLSLSLMAGCASSDDTTPTGPPNTFGTSLPTAEPTPEPSPSTTSLADYQTPNSACPEGWVGLPVSVTDEAELPYLESVPACMSGEGEATQVWLQNNSDVVWAISFPPEAVAERTSQGRAAAAYRAGIKQDRPGRMVFAPDDQVGITADPFTISWALETGLNVGWETQKIALEELQSWGGKYAVAGLGGKSPIRSAVAQCALSGYEIGSTVSTDRGPMSAPEVQSLMTDVLGVGVAGNKCWDATRSVAPPANAEDLGSSMSHLVERPSTLEGLHGRMTWLQRGITLVEAIHPRG